MSTAVTMATTEAMSAVHDSTNDFTTSVRPATVPSLADNTMNDWKAVLAGLVASTGALMGSGLVLLFGRRAEQAASWLSALAIGTLLGAAILGLLPRALADGPVDRTMLCFLAGIVGFILFERALRWRHSHSSTPDTTNHATDHAIRYATAALILWTDALHNFVDGWILGVSFGASRQLGLGTTLAVMAHEIPQEVGDFAVLLTDRKSVV